MRATLLLLLPLLLILAACESDVVITPYTPPDARLVELYERVPAFENCYPGVLRDTESVRALGALNALRTLHYAPAVEYTHAAESLAVEVALATAANGGTPRPGGLCATPDLAANAAQCVTAHAPFPATGPLATSAELVERMFMNGGTEARATMLDPFLRFSSYGRVDGPTPIAANTLSAGALYLRIPGYHSLHGWLHDYVAYPSETYPARFFDSTFDMFLILVVDRTRPEMRVVNYDSARVSVETESGEPLPVTITTRRNSPNLLAWRAPIQPGVRYWVRIDDAVVEDVSRTYRYWVQLQP